MCFIYSCTLWHTKQALSLLCAICSRWKRNSLGKAQLDKLLSALLFCTVSKGPTPLSSGTPTLMAPPVTTLGTVGQKVFLMRGRQHA